jgi:hypothetical protein
MSDIQGSIKMLQSNNPIKRYDACQELRLSRQPLPQEAIIALNIATKDSNSDVADASQQGLGIQSQFDEQEQNEPTTTKEELWAIVPTAGLLIVIILYYILSAEHPAWG